MQRLILITVALAAAMLTIPAYTATVSVQVVAGNDDAEERVSDGYMYRDSTDLELISDDSTAQVVGIRFTNVTIGKGANISNAVIDFVVDETDSEATSVTFHGQAADNPAGFSATDFDITNRPQTVAAVAWNNIPDWTTVGTVQTSPDIGAIIQEIVNRSGWVSGNSIVILIDGSGQRTAEAYEGVPASAPTLRVTFTAADLAVTKSVNDSTPAENQTIVYSVTVTNNGPETATGIDITDLLPAGVTYLSDDSSGTYNSSTGLWEIASLNSGSDTTLLITASVDAGTIGSTIVNTATRTASAPPDGNSANDVATASINVLALEADIDVDVIATPSLTSETATVVYTLTVSNNGPRDATGIELTDALPAGVTYVSDDGGGTYNSTSGVWTLGTLANGNAASLNITVTVNTGTVGTTITNTASRTASSPTDPTAANDADSADIVVVPPADIAVVKTVDIPVPEEGQTIVYTVQATNNGPSNAVGVQVTDLLPAGVTYVADDRPGKYNAGTGLWTIGTLNNSAISIINITCTVDAGTAGTIITNTASRSSGSPADFVAGNDSDSVDIDPIAADIAITKSVSAASPTEGDTIIYAVTATNNGPSDATGVVVTDLLPAGVTYVTDDAGGAYTEATGVWNIGPLANAANATLNIIVVVDSGVGGSSITNSAALTTSTPADGDSSNNSAFITIAPVAMSADLAITKTDSVDPVAVSGNLTYTLTVSTAGPADAEDVTVTDSLPTGVTFVSASSTQGTCSNNGGSVTCDIGTMASSASPVTITINVTAPSTSGTIGNTASVDSLADDPDLSNNSASEGTIVGATGGQTCYAVADSDNRLTKIIIDPASPPGTETAIGITAATTVEAIAYDGTTGTLYGANGDTLGILNQSSAAFAAVGGTFGTATGFVGGVLSSRTLDDVDGMSFDYMSGALYATNRETGDDLLFQVNVATGTFVEDAFGPNKDFVEITAPFTSLPDIDDIAVDFDDGRMYGVVNSAGGSDLLVRINKNTGAATQIGTGLGVSDMEGLGSDNDGNIYGTTGGAALYLINTTTGTASFLMNLGVSGGSDYEAIDCQCNIFAPSVDLSVAKYVNNAAPAEAETVTYTVTVTNNGPSNASVVKVPDALPGGVTYSSSSATQGTYDTSTGVWVVGYLESGQMESLTIAATVDSGTAGTTITNTAGPVTLTSPSDTNSANNSASVDIVPTAGRDLVIDKSHLGTFITGTVESYTLIVSNVGGLSLSGTVTVTDPLPTGLTYSSASGGGWSCSESPAGTMTCTRPGPVPAGSSLPAITLNVNVTAAGGTSVINQASVASSGNETNTSNNSDSDLTFINAAGTQQCFAVADGGDQLVKILAPGGPHTTIGSGLGVADVEAIAYDATTNTLYAANANQLGTINQTTGVFSAVAGTFGSGDGAAGPVTMSDVDGLTIDYKSGAFYGANRRTGDDVLFQINPATGTVVADAFGPGVDYIVITAPFTSLDDIDDITIDFDTERLIGVVNGGTGSDTLVEINKNTGLATEIASGVTIGITDIEGLGSDNEGNVWATTGDGGTNPNSLININEDAGTGTVDSALPGGGLTDYEAIDCVCNATTPVTDLAVTKSVDNAVPAEGATIIYTMTVTNYGPADATVVKLPDALPTGVTFVSASATQGSYDSGAGLWTIGYMNASSVVSLTITATVDTGTAGATITNTAGAVTLASPTDTNSANNSASADINPALFSFTPDVTIDDVEKGSMVCAPHTISNLGSVADTYDLTPESPLPPEINNVLFFEDNGPVGVLNLTGATPDVALTDTDSDTFIDTGSLASTSSINILICYAVKTTFTAPATIQVTTTATSSLQPTAIRMVTDTLNVIAVPDLVVMKTVETFSDPINAQTGPYAIPGAYMHYRIRITNTGEGEVDLNTLTITDPIPSNSAFFTGDLASALSGSPSGSPVVFIDGSGVNSSAMNLTFTTLASTTDDIAFSKDGVSYTYNPAAIPSETDADGFNSTVSHIKVNPQGMMNGATPSGNPYFEIIFRIRIK